MRCSKEKRGKLAYKEKPRLWEKEEGGLGPSVIGSLIHLIILNILAKIISTIQGELL